MISISALSYRGAPVEPLAARFDEAGGSIGRADINRLILPDPERTVSRVHAEVVHQGRGEFAIVNRGGNPIGLNGQPLETGGRARLGVDDELRIGAYVLRVAAAASSAIPPDWDPFAIDEPGAAPAAPAARAAPAAPQPVPVPQGFEATAGDGSLDSLFGLSAAPAADPLGAWGPSASAPVVPPAAVPAAAPAMASSDRDVAPAGSVLSWKLPLGESLTLVGPARSAAAAAPAADVFDDGTTIVAPGRPPARQSDPPSAPAPAAWARPPAGDLGAGPPPAGSVTASADVQALARAWREGLGAQGLPPEALQLTPVLLGLLGRLLREATRGTIDLLAARAALKREIRAEMTMIVARENNPLKFSSSADVALAHLLGAPERGFMPGDHAMRDAYEDLRAHQFATLAGMRAALEGIFTRFDPAVLEAKLTQKSLVESLMPAARKARMWDLFNEMYAQIAAEASDDFHELFGRAFLRAYEEHIAELAKERR